MWGRTAARPVNHRVILTREVRIRRQKTRAAVETLRLHPAPKAPVSETENRSAGHKVADPCRTAGFTHRSESSPRVKSVNHRVALIHVSEVSLPRRNPLHNRKRKIWRENLSPPGRFPRRAPGANVAPVARVWTGCLPKRQETAIRFQRLVAWGARPSAVSGDDVRP